MTKISCITRSKWSDLETLHVKPGVGEGGGGIVLKYLNLRKCCRDMHFTNDFADPNMQPVIIIEPMAFHGSKEGIESNIKKLASHNSIKLLWCEEQAIFRWKGRIREQILSLCHGVVACNAYQAQLLKVIVPNVPIYTLYTPIDSELYKPVEKKRQIIVAGKVGLQKNTAALVKLFQALPSDVNKVYCGNAGMWGQVTYEADKKLELELARVTDEYVKEATPLDVAKFICESLVAVNCSIYDVGSLFALESGLGGCWFYAWRYHPMFDEYENFHRFDNLADGIRKITKCLETETQPNEKLRAELEKKHSYPAFRSQLRQLLGEVFVSGTP